MWYNVKDTDYLISKEGLLCSKTGKVWPGSKTSQGYYELVVERKRVKVYRKLVHVILAELFLVKPEGSYVVDHKDNDKTNNNLSNLQYVLRSKNTSKGQEVRDASKTFKAVNQYTLENVFVATHASVKAACIAIGVNGRSPMICYACNGKCSTNNCNTAYGFKWKFVEDDIVQLPQ